MSEKSAKGKTIEPTPDGHHVIIDGRKWRATNPNLPPEEKEKLVRDLMKARRDVGAALRHKDAEAEENARARVQAAKEALGERGPKWWENDKKDVVHGKDDKEPVAHDKAANN